MIYRCQRRYRASHPTNERVIQNLTTPIGNNHTIRTCKRGPTPLRTSSSSVILRCAFLAKCGAPRGQPTHCSTTCNGRCNCRSIGTSNMDWKASCIWLLSQSTSQPAASVCYPTQIGSTLQPISRAVATIYNTCYIRSGVQPASQPARICQPANICWVGSADPTEQKRINHCGVP